ncbi:MAG: hypothetical protein JJT87_12430 [Halomonas sp.]|nr:hypothetical protein [Halomonas sp.]MCC5902716.1 hypothetical protein [Halomonas sp.]
MTNQVTTADLQKDFVNFFAGKLIEAYREIDPDFAKDTDPTDAFADALLHEYNGIQWKPSVAVTVSGIPNASEDVVFFEADDSEPVIQKDVSVAGIIDLHFEVLNPGEGEYKLNIDVKTFGHHIGGLVLNFDKGVLSTNNEYLSPAIDIWYRATINFNNGFHIEFDADVKPWLVKKFHIGPLNLDV